LFATTLENTFTPNDLNNNVTNNLVSLKLIKAKILPQNLFPYTNPLDKIRNNKNTTQTQITRARPNNHFYIKETTKKKKQLHL